MPRCRGSKKIRRKPFLNCARWRPIAPPPIFAAGSAFRLNGAAQAAGQFPTVHSIGQRSSPYHLAGNRNASHLVNAILNYAYAALESDIRIKGTFPRAMIRQLELCTRARRAAYPAIHYSCAPRQEGLAFLSKGRFHGGAPIFGHDQRWNDRREGAPT